MGGPFTFSRFRIAILLAFIFMGTFLGLLLHMIASKAVDAGEIVLVQQTALDAFGRETSGQITSTQKFDSKRPIYYLWYNFQAEGKHYVHYSSVPLAAFTQATVGTDVRVIYLPTVPEVSRVAQSNDRAIAEDKIRTNRVLQRFAWVLPFLGGLYVLVPKRRHPSKPRQIS